MGCLSARWCKTLITKKLILHNFFINYFHACLIIRNLTKHMRFMTLLTISHFLQVQCIKRDYLTKDDYFSKQEGFIIIYLL
jgi:hypothetical protein